ncbi:MAG: hypothetical protein ACTSRZ_05595 [Promethearchaeota archaeon]
MTDFSKKSNSNNEDDKYIDGYGEPDLYNYHIEPSFTIDEEGRVICTSHSEINQIKTLGKHPHLDYQFELLNTCLTCRHYEFDDCYFPRSEIDKIERDRNNRKLHCMLCGAKIDRMLSIMHSFYYKSKYNIEIPFICCSCYASLNNGTFAQKTRAKFSANLFALVISLILLFRNFITVIALFSFWGLLFFLIPLIFWAYISIRNISDIYLIWKGKKYYEKFFKAPDDRNNTTKDSNNNNKPLNKE